MRVGLALNQGHEHIEIEDAGALLRDAEILERLGRLDQGFLYESTILNIPPDFRVFYLRES